MNEVKEKIKSIIDEKLRNLYKFTTDEQVTVTQTINELIKAYHNAERPRYNKKPYYKKYNKNNKYQQTFSMKEGGR